MTPSIKTLRKLKVGSVTVKWGERVRPWERRIGERG